MSELNFISPCNKLSYGRVGINLLSNLRQLGVKVNLYPIGPIEFDEKSKEKEHIEWALTNSETADFSSPVVKLWHASDMSIPDVFTGRHLGFTIFELNRFTPQEMDQLEDIEVINCTRWADSVCKDWGVKTAGIVNLGVDREIFNERSFPLGPTTFLHLGKCEIRKSADIIPTVFSSAFKNTDNVKLIMAFDNPFYSKEDMNSWINYYKNILKGFNIEFVPRLESQEEVADLIGRSHVGLCFSRAEGWNLDMLEMLSMGRHVISTMYSGHTEFLNKDNSFTITPKELEPAIDSRWFFGQGEWAKISDSDVADMANALKFLYWKHQTKYMGLELNEAGIETAKKFSWERSAKQLLEILSRK